MLHEHFKIKCVSLYEIIRGASKLIPVVTWLYVLSLTVPKRYSDLSLNVCLFPFSVSLLWFSIDWHIHVVSMSWFYAVRVVVCFVCAVYVVFPACTRSFHLTNTSVFLFRSQYYYWCTGSWFHQLFQHLGYIGYNSRRNYTTWMCFINVANELWNPFTRYGNISEEIRFIKTVIVSLMSSYKLSSFK